MSPWPSDTTQLFGWFKCIICIFLVLVALVVNMNCTLIMSNHQLYVGGHSCMQMHVKTDSPKRVVTIVMSILRPFLVISLPATLMQKYFHIRFLQFCKKKYSCLINGHFKTISCHFLANYIDVFHKTEDHMVILIYYWLKYVLCLQMHDFRGYLWSEFLIPQNKISTHVLKMLVLRLTIPRFKDFGIMHLKYEIRISPKNYNKVTGTLYSYYEIACIRH